MRRSRLARSRNAASEAREAGRRCRRRSAQRRTALAAARGERLGFIARLRREQSLKVAQINALETVAQRVVHKSAAIQAAATADSTGSPPHRSPRRSRERGAARSPSPRLATRCPGRTATGLPVGWGVVAVDPAVIPLGTRMTIPGYGEGVAADTGSAVRGATIDLWFPTAGPGARLGPPDGHDHARTKLRTGHEGVRS